jgi:predicted ribosome quality control (RQC) complex YloA/Tae2 family protein
MKSVMITDSGGKSVEIDLDPRLSPLENMNAFFKRYRKLKSRERYIEDNVRRQEGKLSALADYERALAQDGLPDIRRSPSEALSLLDVERTGKGFREAIKRSLGFHSGSGEGVPAGRSPRGNTSPGGKNQSLQVTRSGEGKKEFLRFASRTGKAIYVGRNARENEFLSTRIARGNDLWFHALGGAGSHVILRYDKNGEFRDIDIDDAALLALYFSKLRKQGEGEIVYTHCKFVKKPKNVKEGMVIYHHNKARNVRLEEKLLKALMGKEYFG